jgi:hypothetical protein
MGGCLSGEAERPSRTERSISSVFESSRLSRDFVRDQARQKDFYNQAIERGRMKMQKYQQAEIHYQNEDRDTFTEFKKNFGNTIYKIEDCIEITSINSSGEYKNKIDVENGKITGIMNRCDHPNSEQRLDCSEIVFNQLRLAMEYLNVEIPSIEIKCWYDAGVINEQTKRTAELFFPEERDKYRSVKGGEKTFRAGTDAFTALAGTSTAQSKFYLLAQHPEFFRGKKVTSITVIRWHRYPIIDINYEFGS